MKQNWEYKKLGEVCDILDSQRKPVTKNKRKGGEFPYYGATGIQDYVDSYIFDGRYLLVGEDGAKWASNEKTAFIIEGKSWVNNHAHILQVNDTIKDSLLEYYLCFTDLSSYITGAVVPKLTQQALRSISIPVPPLSTQTAIVSELDALSAIIADHKSLLKKYDELEQSIFYDMFGDPVKNDKGWEVKKLGEVCNITSSKRIFANEYTEIGIPFFRSKEVIEKSKGMPISTELYITEKRYLEIQKNYGVPKVGDILITAVGTIGKIWVVDTAEKFYFKDGNLVWLKDFKEEVAPIFFRYSLSFIIDSFKESNANGAAYAALTIEKLKVMKCVSPPLPLQQEFASKIEAIEAMKADTKKSLAKSEELFNARMDYYFNA